MKHSLALTTLLLAPLAALCGAAESTLPAKADAAAQKTQSFLFIGNSFTFRHELKGIFKTLAAEGNPGKNFITERVVYGGRDLFRHFELFRSQDLLRLQTLSDADLKRSIAEMDALAQPTEPAFYTEYWKQIDSSALRPWEGEVITRARPQPFNRLPSEWIHGSGFISPHPGSAGAVPEMS